MGWTSSISLYILEYRQLKVLQRGFSHPRFADARSFAGIPPLNRRDLLAVAPSDLASCQDCDVYGEFTKPAVELRVLRFTRATQRS